MNSDMMSLFTMVRSTDIPQDKTSRFLSKKQYVDACGFLSENVEIFLSFWYSGIFK